MNKSILLILVSAITALSVGIFAQYAIKNPEVKSDTSALPAIVLPDLQGKQRNISEWQGKVIIVNFWATWCPPCLREIPEFITLQQELGDKGLQFIGIAIEDLSPVAEYAKTMHINYPILIGDENGIALSVALGNIINAVPFSVVIDQQGHIIHRHPGEFSRQQILDIVKPLLKTGNPS